MKATFKTAVQLLQGIFWENGNKQWDLSLHCGCDDIVGGSLRKKRKKTTSNWLSISQPEVTASIFNMEAKQASKCTSNIVEIDLNDFVALWSHG